MKSHNFNGGQEKEVVIVFKFCAAFGGAELR
jgi:hypothetical protein